jgi:ABC-2 type transport system permease protein
MGKALGQLLGSALVQLPAVWLLAGIAVALFGLVPRLAAAAWGPWSPSWCSPSSARP